MQVYELSKMEKEKSVLESKVVRLKSEINKMTVLKSHYCIRNVKRREERNFATRTGLRKEKNKFADKSRKQGDEIASLKMELKKAQCTARLMTNVCQRQMTTIRNLRKDKLSAIKKAMYHQQRNKGKAVDKRESIDDGTGLQKEIETKKGKEFSDEIRFCVMELAALEVATAKMEAVMATVGELCGVRFKCLPSRTACQLMIDEGQVLAKRFIREKVLKRCKSFGIHKDGTTRKKVKILDTSVNTDSGEAFCLGWSSVVSETGQAIADEVKEKFEEIVDASSEEGLRVDLLKKLEYQMNDRAANEKKSAKLIDEWRDEMLTSQGVKPSVVHHLHCAAHVLLGFHSYTIAALKKLDFVQHNVNEVLWDASVLFAPVGDYRGLRPQWQGLCKKKQQKSWIQNYKDNRFNGLFEVAAQVFHHHQDFVQLLESHTTGINKQTNVMKSLSDPDVILLLECLGLFFHSVTGPYWNMVISPKTSHPEF